MAEKKEAPEKEKTKAPPVPKPEPLPTEPDKTLNPDRLCPTQKDTETTRTIEDV